MGNGFPAPEPEFKFCEARRWRFDYAFSYYKVAIELEGGIWTGGAHTRGKHFESDCEKYNTAAIDGWILIRLPWEWVEDGRAYSILKDAFKAARQRM